MSSIPWSWSQSKLVRGWKFFIICITVLGYLLMLVQALHENMCFKLHNAIPNSIGYENGYEKESYGWFGCSYQPSDVSGILIDVSPVKYNGDWLFGWLQVNVKLKMLDAARKLRYTVMQAQTASDALIPGEFFNFRGQGRCGAYLISDQAEQFPTVKKSNFLPCLYASDPNPIVPYAFAYKAQSNRSNDGPQEVAATWRAAFPPCEILNESRPLYFHAYVLHDYGPDEQTSETCDRVSFPAQHLIYFRNYVGGASDPAPPRNAVTSCATTLSSLGGSSNPDWPLWLHRLEYKEVIEAELFFTNRKCTESVQKKNVSGKIPELFYGRCQSANDGTNTSMIGDVGPDKRHYCPDTRGYYEKLPNQEDKLVTRNYSADPDDAPYTFTDFPANGDLGKRIFSYRQGHAVFMIITCTLFVPISHFIAHFFKETFLKDRILNFHIWYSVHLNLSMFAFLSLFTGMFASMARSFLGFSRSGSATAHDAVGWLAILIFFVTLATSSVRMTSLQKRLISIFVHYFGGAFFYALAWFAIMLSCYIPASPSAKNDIHRSGFKFEYFLIPIFMWIIFDLTMFILLNYFMLSNDKSSEIKRKVRSWAMFPFFGVPIPRVRPYSKKDYPGGTLRKILLGVYVGGAVFFTTTLLSIVLTSSSRNRFFGKMEYTHDDYGRVTDIEDFYDDEGGL